MILVCVCGLMVKTLLVQGWREEAHKTDLFVRSPGCMAVKDPSEIDQSLPPCFEVPLTVAAKPERTDSFFSGESDHPRVYRSLTLRDQYGRTWTVGGIYQDMWDSLRIGDPVSVKVWRGRYRPSALTVLTTRSST